MLPVNSKRVQQQNNTIDCDVHTCAVELVTLIACARK
jgi:hypothetical protein